MFFVILDTNSLVIPSEGKEKLGFGHCKEFEVMWTNLLRIRKITWSVFRYIAQWYCFNVVIWERNKRKKEENKTQENDYMSNLIHGNRMRAFDWLNERLASCNIQTATWGIPTVGRISAALSLQSTLILSRTASSNQALGKPLTN